MSSNIEENKKEESEEEEAMLQEKSEDKTESHQESDEGKESDEESESKVDNPSILEKDNTIVELQLGDIIHITSPLNETLNDQLFSIEYIDSSKIELINTDTLNKIRLTISKDGFLGDGTIERIAIRSRLDTPSYARQNGLLPGKWINIYFGGEFPIIITGEITNLEKDMIEIKSIDGDILYINFEYKGIPEDLPIELIEIREAPSSKEIKKAITEEELDLEEELPELEREKRGERVDIAIPIHNVRDQIREFIIKADQVHFGSEELGPVASYIDVSLKSQRYSLETQVSDLLDELLSTIPSSNRTNRVLNNIHIMIDRFKQLRERFSSFDSYNNVDGFLKKEATNKPLMNYFEQFKQNLYWILPVVKNVKKLYDVNHDAENNTDIVNLSIETNLKSIMDLISTYKSNNLPDFYNKYTSLYYDLNPYFTPFEVVDEYMEGVITEKMVFENITTIVDNLENMYSSIFTNSNVRDRRFVIQKYNMGVSNLDTIDSTSSKLITIRNNITDNEIMSIKSFMILPEPFIRFSKINLPGTNILEKANLNTHFLNYWQLLKKKTNVNTIFIDDIDSDLNFDENNFANSIKNFVLNLDPEEKRRYSGDSLYNKLANMIIPKTKILFNLMKKYIHGKLSIIEVVSYLEPFLIYSDDLTYNQYLEITKFIDEKISQFNKFFITRSRLFNTLSSLKSNSIISTRAFTIIEILSKNLRNSVFSEGYDLNDPEKNFTNSEILRKILIKDCSKLYTTAISLQNISLMFPSEFSTLFEEEKKKIDEKSKGLEDEKCKSFVIAKYYDSIEALNADNDKIIYFDKRYDKTNYGLLESKDGYEKQVMTMSLDELRAHIKKDLVEKKRMSQPDAEYLANTLVDGHKQIIDGQYAILYKGYSEKTTDEVDFYIRKDNKWVLDRELNKLDVNTDQSSILCDLQQQCMNIPDKTEDKCESMKENEFSLQTKLLKDVLNEFDEKYKISTEDFEKSMNTKFEYLMSIIAITSKIDTNKMLKYNNIRYKLGTSVEEQSNPKPISPYLKLLNLILKYPEFVQKQNYIIKFVNTYTRPSIQGIGALGEIENEHWLYCIKTNVPLLPTFIYNLANSFIVEGEYGYIQHLEIVKSKIGKLSDDGDWWCDKFSGWGICPVDFDFEEGYEASGFKASSRAIMEEDAGNKILASLKENSIQYDTPDTIMINNIVNTLSLAMGINLEIQKEFIMNCVLTAIRDTLETESEYKKKVRELAEKGKKSISYVDFYNTALLYYTLGMYLLAVQTSIPSVKTRKTHPGCVRSFSGYPFEGTGDFSSLNYLGCIVYDIRVSSEPWNVLKGKKQEAIITKIKNSIDYLLSYPEVKRKFEEKTEYLLTDTALEIPEEHSIAKWWQFLPPLVNYKIKHLVNISPDFKRSLMSDLRSGSSYQREKMMVIDSKIIQFALAIIEKIQEIVRKQSLLLYSSNQEPYLENACCETNEGETTIEYFINRNSVISEYNEIVTRLSNIKEDVISYSKSGLFYSDINTKNFYPEIINQFNEETIYLSFIYYCKFKTLAPIPLDLLPLCTDKPEFGLINSADSNERIIEKLKNDGRHYTNEQMLRLLQVLSKNNIMNIDINKKTISPIRKLSEFLESIIEENEEVVDRALIDLMLNVMDTYDIAKDEQTKEVRDLNNYLIRNIDSMKEEIISFVGKNYGSKVTKSSVKKMEKTIEKLSDWIINESTRNEENTISDYKTNNIIQFYKTFIDNFINIFPNIILNEVDYTNTHIPGYYGFSFNHKRKLKKYISEYYEKLLKFYGIPTLSNILINIKKSCKNLLLLSKNTPSFTTIKMGEINLIPIFDEKTSKYLFEFYLLRVLIQYIELSDLDEMIVTEITREVEITDIFSVDYIEEQETCADLSITSHSETDIRLLTGNKKQLKQKTAELIISFIDILNNEKDTIDTSYEEIQDRVFKLREKEKDLVTDRLKVMTDEERNTDTILKINKLGMYSKGLQKGLTTLDKDFYDEEQEFRDNMLSAEKAIRRKNPNVSDENIDTLMDEFMEQQQIDREIDDEVNDMSYMNETYYDGNTDGVDAPEEEYQDYTEEY
jgi:hypothetical protein